jgi:hypothetical protein
LVYLLIGDTGGLDCQLSYAGVDLELLVSDVVLGLDQDIVHIVQAICLFTSEHVIMVWFFGLDRLDVL